MITSWLLENEHGIGSLILVTVSSWLLENELDAVTNELAERLIKELIN